MTACCAVTRSCNCHCRSSRRSNRRSTHALAGGACCCAPIDASLRDDDAAARAQALDVTQSFIVRAPAGSGKTELLAQRVLALLAQADAPEEVVAITFTRKAAAEMKDRLLQSLTDATTAPSSPEQPHRALTLQLAQRVTARDRELGWELAANPARLRVQTIDALALWLAQQLPITARFAPITRVTEQADPLYSAAAHATLALIDTSDSSDTRDRGIARHIARLLTHLDNDWPRVHRLLSGMLARRDQWLRHVGHLDRAALEAPMQEECSRQIERVCEALVGVDVEELVALARYAAGNLAHDSRLAPCADLRRLPEASFGRLDAWRALAALLLTNEGTWRTRFSKSEGFPSFAGASSIQATDRCPDGRAAVERNAATSVAWTTRFALAALHRASVGSARIDRCAASARSRRADACIRRRRRERFRATDAGGG